MRSFLRLAVTLIAAAVLAAPLAGQQTSAQKLEAARQLLENSQFDSAAALLQQVIDQDSTSRLQAYVWLGIVHHFGGKDSLARAAFRQVYQLDPNVQLQGVGELDPERLPAILTAARTAAAAADSQPAAQPGAPTPPAAAGDSGSGAARAGAAAARCLPGCVGLDRAPEFVSMPRVSFPDHLQDAARSLDLVVRFVIEADGKVAPRSIHIVRTNVASMGSEITGALAHARFRPGRTVQGSVSVQVEMTFTARSQGGSIVLGPPRRL